MKSQAEVLKLISDWEANPDWELETTPGYEEYYSELYRYRLEKENLWETVRKKHKIKAAESMGLTLPLYEEWLATKKIGDAQRTKASKMLVHLIYDTDKIDLEKQTLIEAFMDGIMRGAINYAKAELIKDHFHVETS